MESKDKVFSVPPCPLTTGYTQPHAFQPVPDDRNNLLLPRMMCTSCGMTLEMAHGAVHMLPVMESPVNPDEAAGRSPTGRLIEELQ